MRNLYISLFVLFLTTWLGMPQDLQAQVRGSVTPTNQTIKSGETPQTIYHSGYSGISSRQWVRVLPGYATDVIPGATGVSFTPPTYRNEGTANVTYTYALQYNSDPGLYYSLLSYVTVKPENPPLYASVSSSQNLISGDTATPLTISTDGGNESYELLYRWQQSTDNATWEDISGATGTSYSVGVVTQLEEAYKATYYRAIVTRGPQTATSASVYINVKPQFIPGYTTVGDQRHQVISSGKTCMGSLRFVGYSGASFYPYNCSQWQSSTNGVTWQALGQMPRDNEWFGQTMTQTTYIRMKFTSYNGYPDRYSEPATIQVTRDPEITSTGLISSVQTISAGSAPNPLTVSAAAGGTGTFTRQWQQSTDGIAWENISGATSTTYAPGNLFETTYFRVEVKSGAWTRYTGACTITIQPYVTPTIGTITPGEQVIPWGTSSAMLSHGNYANIVTRQWQRSTDGGAWTNISGATGINYSPGVLPNAGTTPVTYAFRIQLEENIFTPVVTVKVNPEGPTVAGLITPAEQTVANMAQPELLNHTGYSNLLMQQWQRRINGGTWYNWKDKDTDISDPTPMLNNSAAIAVCEFRVQVAEGVYSNIAIVNVELPVINPGTISPLQQDISTGNPAALLTLSETENVTEGQWQQSSNGTIWYDITGATGTTYSPGNMTNNGSVPVTYHYRVKGIGHAGRFEYSPQVTITVHPDLDGGQILPQTQTVGDGEEAQTLVHTGHQGVITRQWIRSFDAGRTWEDIPGATGETYSLGTAVNDGSEGIDIRYRVVCNERPERFCLSAMIYIKPANPTLRVGISASQSLISGETAEPLTVGASGGNESYELTYQWQQSADRENWTDIPGATASVYSPGSFVQTEQEIRTISYRAVVTRGPQTVISDLVHIGIKPIFIPGYVTIDDQRSVTASPGLYMGYLSLEGYSGLSFYTYRTSYWQSSTDGVNWADIPNMLPYGNEYFGRDFLETTYFRMKYTCYETGAFVYSEPAALKIVPDPDLNPGTITGYQTLPPEGGYPGYMTIEGISGGKPGDLRYYWQKSYNNQDWEQVSGGYNNTQNAGFISQTTYYRVRVVSGIQEKYTPVFKITVGNDSGGENPGGEDPNPDPDPDPDPEPDPETVPHVTVSLSTGQNYIAKHVFSKPFSALPTTISTENAISSVTYYDGLGRPMQTVEIGGTRRKKDMVTPIVYDPVGRNDAMQYLPYKESYGSGAYQPNAIANQKAYLSGLFPEDANRTFVQKVYEASPLNRPIRQYNVGHQYQNHPVTYGYATNSTSEVRKLSVDASGRLVVSSYYAANKLYKNSVINEDGLESHTYTNLLGQTILERTKSGLTIMDTYYVYDDLRRLRWVISPEGAKDLTDKTYPLTDPVCSKFSYMYNYDNRGNLIEKRLPGTESVYFVHDPADRMVASQDGNLRNGNQWMVYKYDAFGRMTNQWEVQYLNGVTPEIMAEQYQTYYTSEASRLFINSVTYDRNVSQEVSLPFAPVSGIVESYDQSRVKGLKTYESLDIHGGGTINRHFYYDTKGRLVQTVEKNHLNGISRYSYKYDFIGNVLAVHESHEANGTTHTVLTENVYDHRGRLITTSTTSEENTATVSYAYNEMGQLEGKDLGGVSQIRLEYNMQGWLTEQKSDNFFMELDYFGDNKFAGNITKWSWRHGSSTDQHYALNYDAFNRLTAGTHSLELFNETITGYDLNGNIQRLTRTANGVRQSDYKYSYNGNQLTKLTGTSSYEYDANGNMTYDARKKLTFRYNSLNLIEEVSSAAGTVAWYYYAADGTKRRSSDYTAWNAYDYLGSLTLVKSGSVTTNEVAFAEGIIRDGNVLFFEKDHLGSVRVMIDSNGNVEQQNDYYPFGMRHNNSDYAASGNNRFLFNGKEQQTIGTIDALDYGARMYDQVIGRWFVPEPLSELYYAQGRYNYCLNNPVKYIDPFGLWTTTAGRYYTDDPTDIARFMQFRQTSNDMGVNPSINQISNFVDWEISGGSSGGAGDIYTSNDLGSKLFVGPAVKIGIDQSGKGTWTNRDEVYNALNPSRFSDFWEPVNPIVKAIHDGHRAFWNSSLYISSKVLGDTGQIVTWAGYLTAPIGGAGLVALGNSMSFASSALTSIIHLRQGNITKGLGGLALSYGLRHLGKRSLDYFQWNAGFNPTMGESYGLLFNALTTEALSTTIYYGTK